MVFLLTGYAAVKFKVEGGKIHLLGTAKTQLDDITAALRQPPDQGRGQGGAGKAHIIPHGHFPGLKKLHLGTPDAISHLNNSSLPCNLTGGIRAVKMKIQLFQDIFWFPLTGICSQKLHCFSYMI
ncbi:hypothetical protein SAMN05660706_1613 [Desulfoscipio geothermicus DSM 3669]|uniref:Uncharacterized protein n=1 Tax=Desulfoscipio geothermicus DSM 3669 TaxID=1121426 RepID=A0A1I6ELD6_9FIRM|nr:hypothetical protein SAMN05660706_1613 [Desulfoscipio geothermicus DSM 3669]